MKNRTTNLLIVSSLLTAMGACASSELPSFSDLDKNADGIVTHTEAAEFPAIAEVFGEIDRDGNATIDKREYDTYTEAK